MHPSPASRPPVCASSKTCPARAAGNLKQQGEQTFLGPKIRGKQRGVGIRFKGEEKTNVEEYCVSEGWIKVPVGNKVDRKGKPLLISLKGKVEAFYK